MTTSAIGSVSASRPVAKRSGAFTLVELLTVVAIMAIVMSVLGYAIGNMGGPAPQVAAAQVASGLSLARQLAVAKNTQTRFVIANVSGQGGVGMPQESWRYWTILMTNKDAANPAANVWFMMKEWERLPAGVVFLNIAAANYSTINGDPIGASVGQPFQPAFNTSLGANNEWRGFVSYGNFEVAVTNQPNQIAFRLTNAPAIGYSGVGEALFCSNSPAGIAPPGAQGTIAVRVAAGVVETNQIILKSTKSYFYVETDKRGRIRVRSPESFRQ